MRLTKNQPIDTNSSDKFDQNSLSVDINQDCSLVNNILYVSNNPTEWLIIDAITGKFRAPRQNEFLYLLLENSSYSSYISWLNRNEGLFKIHEPERIATLWSQVKNRQTNGIMSYDIFARGIRYYYQTGSMVKTNKKHTFRFKLPLDYLSKDSFVNFELNK